MNDSTSEHWDSAYALGDTTRGWYQPEARMSLRVLTDLSVPPSASIVDIGGGASVFVDGLLESGFTDVTVLDHSPVGLRIARERLGARASTIHWIETDLLDWTPARTYDVWHDRAVLHFLLDEDERVGYGRTLHAATAPGSIAIIGVFGPQGPDMCAGLPVRRYDPDDLANVLGSPFDILSAEVADHIRPDGDAQQYLWCVARRSS